MRYREVTRAIIYDDEYRVLLARRARGGDEGRWALIGGKPEGQESPEQTIVREVKEETGLGFSPTLFRQEVDDVSDPRGPWRVSYFSGRAVGVLALDASENLEARYFPRDELASIDVALGHDRILEDFWASVRI